jgi:hypothetical protein
VSSPITAGKPRGLSATVDTVRRMVDISVHTTEFVPYERPHPWGDRSDDLPLSAAEWHQAKTPGSEKSTFVIKALYEAVKQLETELTAFRTS